MARISDEDLKRAQKWLGDPAIGVSVGPDGAKPMTPPTSNPSAMSQGERAYRNLNPHAEARLAMAMWSHEYAHEQRGGSMDFWDGLSAERKRLCANVVTDILAAADKTGRAP